MENETYKVDTLYIHMLHAQYFWAIDAVNIVINELSKLTENTEVILKEHPRNNQDLHSGIIDSLRQELKQQTFNVKIKLHIQTNEVMHLNYLEPKYEYE